MKTIQQELMAALKDIPDFPKKGVVFKDVMPLFLDPTLFKKIIHNLAERIAPYQPTHLVGMESRGFLFAVPLAYEMGIKFVPARKKGKLPGEIIGETYNLEYGTDTLEIQKNALSHDARYFLVDDVLATGGTALAVNNLITNYNCRVVGNLFLLELGFLKGRNKILEKYPDLKINSFSEL